MSRFGETTAAVVCDGNVKASRDASHADPIRAEILDRFEKGQNALAISRELNISFETVMNVVAG